MTQKLPLMLKVKSCHSERSEESLWQKIKNTNTENTEELGNSEVNQVNSVP